MSRHLLYPLYGLAVVGFACFLGLVHTAIEAAITRSQARHAARLAADTRFHQPSHCRTVQPRQEHTG